MSALTRWRKKVRDKGLTQAEKDKDLRRSRNREAFEEFKAKRAEQQRRRRNKTRKNKKPTKIPVPSGQLQKLEPGTKCVQFVKINDDGVLVFYVDLRHLRDNGVNIHGRVYSEEKSEKLIRECVKKISKKKSKNIQSLLGILMKKKYACRHKSGGSKRVYASVISVEN